MAEDAVRARADVIESMEQSAEVYGLSRSAGRVYGVLYLAREPLSIPELVEETGYAKSTISNVTRQLDRIGLVHRRSSGGGGRRVEFEAEADLWFVIQDVLQQYLHREVSATQRSLDRALERLDADAEDREAITELRESYADLEALLETLSGQSIEDLTAAIERFDDHT